MKKNIFLLSIDSVRRDFFHHALNYSTVTELEKDFVKFNKCNSIYTATFNAHYAMFFGDYVFTAKNYNFPHQLKKLGYETCSFFNGVLLIHYNLRELVEENDNNKFHFCDDFVEDLGAKLVFNWKKCMLHKTERSKPIFWRGSADDDEYESPTKWKTFMTNNSNEKKFLFLHFWSTHYNYGINDYLKNKIVGEKMKDTCDELLRRIYKKQISEKFVKEVYTKRIVDVINIHISDLIKILKEKHIYDDSLIIITADHGEGLGDIGFNFPLSLYSTYNRFYWNYETRRKKYKKLPQIKKIPIKWDPRVFFHAGMYEIQKKVPLLIKFPNNEFGGMEYNDDVSFFDIIHTVNDYNDLKLNATNNLGSSLYYLIKYGKEGRERYKIDKSVRKIHSMI